MSEEFSDLKGKILKSVVNNKNKEIIFTTIDGEIYKLYHNQDCCECVMVEDICGYLGNLLNTPITLAGETEHKPNYNPGVVPKIEYQDCFTWTFYRIGTVKGCVTIRWYGESNGYYSESVDFCKL